ncbi:MAG: SiaB family protein kinase [Veillonellales bacterium]
MEFDLLKLQRILQDYGVLINFAGRFTQEIIEELGDAVKKYLETEAISQNETYNVFSVFIEQTQNIKNYGVLKRGSPHGDRIANSGIITIGKTPDGYFVCAGNIIENNDVSALTAKLDEISRLDKAGLKKLFKEQMKKELPPGSLGAGLGLINMARRATRPLHYSVEKLDDSLLFFTLKVNV